MNLTFRPGQAFGVKAPVSHPNDIYRFYEIIYVIYDVLKDASIKFYSIQPYSQMSSLIKPQMEKAILLSDNRSLYHSEKEVFEKLLKTTNAQPL